MEIKERNMLKNEGDRNDGKVILSKRYKASDMESGKDASVLESRARERQKIRGFNKELPEGDSRLKRAKDFGSRRWQYSSVVKGKLDSTTDSHSDTEGVKSTVERKKSLLDKVAEEETELELVLGELGLNRKKRVDSRSEKVRKAQSTRSMTGVDEGKRQTSGEDVQTNPSKTPETGSSANQLSRAK
ncbi:hypothetical protein GIB67_017652 [Kingdonia uniflora]|uniref:Uncharacterized protein n=1 Tax=Kingdonia uniflora TaxID=39325 RepID=A0A7J7NB32_9MAGN|nr:hypothetical protein GIB67_017652 [Kingdonia uniflora]